MAVLGTGGRLVLKRDAPAPCILSDSGLDAALQSYGSICPGYISGDHVSGNCVPVVRPGEFPGNPEGWASYQGSQWFLGPNRTHIADDSDKFYKQGGEEYPDGKSHNFAQFYCRVGDVSGGDEIVGCIENDFYIHIDELGRVSFYDTRCAALAGCKSNSLGLAPVAGDAIIAPYGSGDYMNAVWECFRALHGDYGFSDVADSVSLESICNFAPTYEQPVANPNDEANAYDNADVQPRVGAAPYWECVADLREWSLDLDAPAVDSTGVAEKFGNAVKSLVSGGGSTEFFIDRQCLGDGTTNGMTLMQLLLMTEQGCKASAQFYVLQRPGDCGADMCSGLINGDLYYETDLLITQTAINMRPTELVVGTCTFVSTGPIKLKEAPGS